MANPFAKARWFHKIGHVTNTSAWKLLPTPTGLGLLTTTGRRSGKARVRAIRVIRDGNRLYAVAMLGTQCDWVRNVRAQPRVRVKLGGRTHDAIARQLTDDERETAVDVYLRSAGWFDYVDYFNLTWSLPSRARIRRAHEEWFATGIPISFELCDVLDG